MSWSDEFINHFCFQDALTLHQVAKAEFRALVQEDQDDGAVPDVMSAFQDILNAIFVSLYNHKDAEERCYSDSLAELPEHDFVKDDKGIPRKTRALRLRLRRKLRRILSLERRSLFESDEGFEMPGPGRI